MRRFVQHKWVIPVAALVLVVALGTVAFAATGGTDQGNASAGTTVTTAGPVAAGLAPWQGKMLKGLRGILQQFKGELQGLTPGTQEFRDKVKELAGERRDKIQQRLDNVIKLVREKMTPDEQQQLDKLLEQAKTQRGALQNARQDLMSTMKQIRSLTQKYLAPGAGAVGGGGS